MAVMREAGNPIRRQQVHPPAPPAQSNSASRSRSVAEPDIVDRVATLESQVSDLLARVSAIDLEGS
jgi:hypothetical protein